MSAKIAKIFMLCYNPSNIPMKILITGGAGFIGSHLADALLKEGHSVVALDTVPKSKAVNVSHLFPDKKFTFLNGSIMNAKTMENIISKIDLIFHLAAAVGVKKIIENSLDSLKVNVLGAQLILELASKHRKKIVISSTSEIYGKTTKIPFEENDDRVVGPTTTPRWAYSCSKAINEFFALAYHREKGLKVIIVRFFNVTGPRQIGLHGMVIPRFVDAVLNNKPLVVHGDGLQTRCFCHVKDAVRALILLMNCGKAYGEIFNIGNPRPTTIRELAGEIIRLAESKSKISLISYRSIYKRGFEDIRNRRPSIKKISKYVGYSPKFRLKDIINDIISWKRYEA